MKVHLIDTHLLVPRSRSSAKVKVKYQGNVSQKMGVSGELVVHKHIFFPLHKHFHEAVSSRGSEVLNVPWSVIECKKKTIEGSQMDFCWQGKVIVKINE